MLRPLIALTVLSLLPQLAFAEAELSWQGRVEEKDGLRYVHNPATPMLPPLTVALEEQWRLGGDSEDDAEFFGVINDVEIDEAGDFYLLDTQLNTISVFAADGEFQRSLGREGEGPGEFRNPIDLVLLDEDRIGVIQPFPSKMVLIARDGVPIGDFSFSAQGDGFVNMRGARLCGDRLALLYQAGKPDEGAWQNTSYLVTVDRDGGDERALLQGSSRMELANSLCIERDWNLFANCWTTDLDGRVYAREDFTRYAVRVWDAEGGAATIVTRDYEEHRREKSDIEDIEESWARSIRRWVQSPTFDIEPNWNPIEDIYARPGGMLWVRSSRGLRDLDPGVLARFDVFDAQGRYLRELVLTGRFDPERDGLFIEEEHVVVVTDLVSARDAWRGGGGEEDAEYEPEPMSIIAYRMQLPLDFAFMAPGSGDGEIR